MSPPRVWTSSKLVPFIAVAIGVALRLIPCIHRPDFQWVADAAYHGRLIVQSEETGRLAEVDRQSNAPAGRRTAHELPIGLYRVGIALTRELGDHGAKDSRWSLAGLIALCGGLIAIPAWIGARAASGRALAAGLAALIAVVLPSHLTRSYGYWLRYDAPGTLLIASHAALAIAALASGAATRRRLLSLGSAVLLVAALWVWRVTQVVLLLELAFVLIWIVARGADERVRDWWPTIVVLGTAGVFGIEYLRVQRFVVSPLWLASIGAAIVALVPPLGASRRRAVRALAVIAVGALAVAFGRSSAASGYGTLAALVRARFGGGVALDPGTALLREVEEMRGMSPWTFVAGPDELFLIGAWLLAAPWLLAWLAGGSWRARLAAIEPAPAWLGVVTTGLVASTFLFARTSALLAPFAAIALGVLGAKLFEPHRVQVEAAGGARTKRGGHSPRTPRSGTAGRRALAYAFALTVAATAVAGTVQAFGAFSRLPDDKREALAFVADQAPRDAIVLSLWDDGYDIQMYGRRPTVVDGLLESVENRTRIVALDRALMQPTPDSLAALCDHSSARWLFMPPASFLHSVAVVAGDPVAGKIERGQPLVAGVDTRHIAFPLMMGDAAIPGFRLAHASGGYRVYEHVGR